MTLINLTQTNHTIRTRLALIAICAVSIVAPMALRAQSSAVPHPSEIKQAQRPVPIEKGAKASVILSLVVDTEGNTQNIQIIASPGAEWDKLALHAIQSSNFKSLRNKKKPITLYIKMDLQNTADPKDTSPTDSVPKAPPQ